MAIFNSYVKLPEGILILIIPYVPTACMITKPQKCMIHGMVLQASPGTDDIPYRLDAYVLDKKYGDLMSFIWKNHGEL